jgi:hypothetical protein
MQKFLLAVCFLASLLTGCSRSSEIVGTWSGTIEAPKEKAGLVGGLRSFAATLVGPMTIEFNADGRYKASSAVSEVRGSYSVAGNEVRLQPEDKKEEPQVLRLSEDGKTLSTAKEFASDAQVIFTKAP